MPIVQCLTRNLGCAVSRYARRQYTATEIPKYRYTAVFCDVIGGRQFFEKKARIARRTIKRRLHYYTCTAYMYALQVAATIGTPLATLMAATCV